MSWHQQGEIDEITRDGIASKLRRLIERYDGSPDAAARDMDMDCRPFEDALVERHRSLDAA